MKTRISLFILLLFISVLSYAQEKQFTIAAGNLKAGVTAEGLISLSDLQGNGFRWPLRISASLKGCETTGQSEFEKLSDGGIAIKRLVKNSKSGFSAYLTERFVPAGGSIRCEIEITGTGEPWTTEISTGISFRAGTSSRIWIPWGDPRISKECFPDNGIQSEKNISIVQNWTDPLLPRKFFNDTLFYGAPYFQYEKPGISFIPFHWDLFCITMVYLL
jgi:hypothetical protein